MNGKRILAALVLAAVPSPARPEPPWPRDKALAWQKQAGWLVGCNFIPSSAINQLEMWQAETFDPETIDRELGWAEGLGFTSVRVFLHHLLWVQERERFLDRAERFLAIAERHHIGVLFVLLDGVWDPFPKPGPQRAPKPHVHNSGWVQSPGVEILREPARHDELRDYVAGVVRRFREDRRVHAWDLFNEPDNLNRQSYGEHEPPNKAELALQLLEKTFAWAREAAPAQPLTAGVWLGTWEDEQALSPIERFMLEHSDVISFHNYGPPEEMRKCVRSLKRYGRPLLCTEYMARPNGSRFDPILGLLKEESVGAYNWGFVAGKTQTIYPWDSWEKPYTAEPAMWFHDIFRKDGTPFDPREVEFIRRVTGRTR